MTAKTDSVKKEKLSSFARFYGLGLLWLIVPFALDQWTKVLAIRHLMGQDSVELIPGIFRLEYLENRGAAFGMMQGKLSLLLLFTILVAIVLIWAICRMPRTGRYLLLNRICFLMLAGAFGNVVDRVFRGYVVDFLSFYLINFPVFNVADICAVCAAIGLCIVALFVYTGEHDFDFLMPH